jgi:hypothetical protein
VSDVISWIQAGSWLAAVGALIISAAKFRSDLGVAREQRERDLEQQRRNLRWKQAEAGKRLNDELLADPEVKVALRIVDFPGYPITLPQSSAPSVGYTDSDVDAALDPNTPITDTLAQEMRQCFDALFFYFAEFEHHIQNGFVHVEDVAFPLDYYIRRMRPIRAQVEKYLEYYELERSAKFFARYQ